MGRVVLLESMAVFLLGLFAPLGLLVLSLPNLFRRMGSGLREWSLVWFVPVALTLLAELVRQDFMGIITTLIAGLYLWLVCLHTQVSDRMVRAGRVPVVFAAVMLVMLMFSAAELWLNSSRWYHPDPRVVSGPNFLAWDVWRFQGLPRGDFVRRAWRVPQGVRDLELNLEVRAVTPVLDQWVVSDPNYRLETVLEAGESFTRVATPLGADPFLAWSFDTGSAVAGRLFRVSLEMRSAAPVTASGCRGVWLQADGGGYAAKCQPVSLEAKWKRVSLNWVPPRDAKSPNRIRVVLNDFDGLSYDVRRVRLEEQVGAHWTPISSLWLRIGALGQVNHFSLFPASEWQVARLPLHVSPSPRDSTLEGVLWLGSSSLEVRRVRAVGSGRALEPVNSVNRVALWFAQPNLLGHTVAALLLCGLAISKRGWLSLLLAVLGLVLIALTGSRTALLVVALGIPLLALQNLSARARPLALSVMVVLAVLALVVTPGIRRDGISLLDDGNSIPRTRIWQIAWRATLEYPFGLGSGGFPAFFESQVGDVPHDQIQHAHNFWLELSARYGFLGLVASVWISFGLVWVGWNRGRWRGLTLVILMLLLNITDNTLLYQGVFCPFILTLNALLEVKDGASNQV
jgi:hypothetical protein